MTDTPAAANDATAPEPPDSRVQRVRVLVDAWRTELAELGGPNALLWFDDEGSSALELTRAHPAGIARLLSVGVGRLRDIVREPGAHAEALGRAVAISEQADDQWRDRGLVTCYFVAGMATWSTRGRTGVPHAPVLLRRCRLTVLPDASDAMLSLSAEVVVNPALISMLEADRGVTLDAAAIGGMAVTTTGFNPSAAVDELRRQCASVPGFRVDPRLLIDNFLLDKLPLVRDVTGRDEAIAANEVVAALAGDSAALAHVAADAPGFDEVPLTGERLVLDADAPQQEIVEAVRAGAHLSVRAPTGTGATQTIVNLIAALAADRRRVLVVSSRRSAIDDVLAALASVGLSELAYDVQSSDGQALADLQVRLMAYLAQSPAPQSDGVDHELEHLRTTLADHMRCMHEPREPWGITLAQAQSEIDLLGRRRPAPRSRARLTGEEMLRLAHERRDEVREVLERISQIGAWTTSGRIDPWYGADIVGADQARRSRELVASLLKVLPEHRARIAELCDVAGLPLPTTMREADDRLELLDSIRRVLETFRSEVFDEDLEGLAIATAGREQRKAAAKQLGGMERRRLQRTARALLRPGRPPQDLHGSLSRAVLLRKRWRELAGPGSRPAAPAGVAETLAANQDRRLELEWLGQRLASTPAGDKLLDTPLGHLQTRLADLDRAADRLTVAAQVHTDLDKLRRLGLGPLLDDLAVRQVSADGVVPEFEFVWWTSLLAHFELADPAYGGHDGDALRATVADYRRADAAHVAAGAARVRDDVARHVHRVIADLPNQVDTFDDILRSGSPSWVPGALLRGAPELTGAAAPAWLMSPYAVATLVPPGTWFDVVIVDHAESLSLAEAVPALTRAGQVVAFGDGNIGAPHRFSLTGEATPGRPLRSLHDALGSVAPVRELRTVYGARDERLITFSNAHASSGRLEGFPAAVDESVARLDVVDADDGTSRVVQLIEEHLSRSPAQSLAIVTLTKEHAARVREQVARVIGRNARRVAALEALPEPFVVVDVDRVIGLRRDVIILSVGHRLVRGGLPEALTPLNADSGASALIAAATRARRSLAVVSPFSSDDLDGTQLRSRGAILLRELLAHAATGGSARGVRATPGDRKGSRRRRMASTGSVLDRRASVEPGPVPVSPLLEELADRLRAERLVVRTSHGVSSRRIDLVVDDPMREGVPLLAIETDSREFADVAATRDRERLRPEQLEARGWVVERVYTRDLFRDPAREVARIAGRAHAESQSRRPKRTSGWLDAEGNLTAGGMPQ